MSENLQTNQVLAEDEIDLRELWNTIWSNKIKIVLFSVTVTVGAVFYALSQPNIYESKAVLMPQEQGKASVGGGLAALAGMAGVDIGGGGAPKAEDSYTALLSNYSFMKYFVIKNNLHNRLRSSSSTDNFKFALGSRFFYDAKNFSFTSKGEVVSFNSLSEATKESILFGLSKSVGGSIQVQSDKKTSLLIVSVKHPDALLAKDLVEMFLRDASAYLRDNEMSDNENKIKYYDEALQKTSDVSLKSKLAELESALIQKKVLAQANPYYNVKLLTKPEVPYMLDKAGPKRGLVVAVAFVTSLILGIFGVFFLEFIRGSKRSEANS